MRVAVLHPRIASRSQPTVEGSSLQATLGCVADRGLRVLWLPAPHLSGALRSRGVPARGGGYRGPRARAQPPPVPTAEVSIDDELRRLLQTFRSFVRRWENESISTPRFMWL